MTAPPDRVVAAFGGAATVMAPLAGGQGAAWRAGDIVLKPADDEASIAWTARLMAQVADGDDFRLARPVPAGDGRWLLDGWAATTWLTGEHQPGRWDDILDVSATLHARLRTAQIGAPPPRSDPWTVGCRVAWDDCPEWRPTSVSLAALMADVAPLLHAAWTGATVQTIHGDLGGNVVFADGLAPAVIDFSPHQAPAPFADAVIVADALAWEGAPPSLAERFVQSRPAGGQLLARAVVFRAVVAEALSGADDRRVQVEIEAYRPAIDIALAHGG